MGLSLQPGVFDLFFILGYADSSDYTFKVSGLSLWLNKKYGNKPVHKIPNNFNTALSFSCQKKLDKF